MYLSNRAMYRKDHIMAQLWANRWEDANNQLRSLETKKYEL